MEACLAEKEWMKEQMKERMAMEPISAATWQNTPPHTEVLAE
jgi:hypothetical protein